MTRRHPARVWLAFGLLAVAVFAATAALQRRLQTLHDENQTQLNDERWEQAITLALWRMEGQAHQLYAQLARVSVQSNPQETAPIAWIDEVIPSSPPAVAAAVRPDEQSANPIQQRPGFGGYGNVEPVPQTQARRSTQSNFDNTFDTQNRAQFNPGRQQQALAFSPQEPSAPSTPPAQSIPVSSMFVIERIDGQLFGVAVEMPSAPSPAPAAANEAAANQADSEPQRTPRFRLNETAITQNLLAVVQDLLPGARLIPIQQETDAPLDRQLASLPLALNPGPRPAHLLAVGNEAIWATLFFSGSVVMGALLIMAVLLAALLRVNRQRTDFVAAVTHEMRTPLTTFQMYTEMLAHGMVPADKQARYHQTLHGESIRLNRLIENVLAFARLERRQKDRDETAPPRSNACSAARPDPAAPAKTRRAGRRGVGIRNHPPS